MRALMILAVAAVLVVAISPAKAGNPINGKRVFETNCATCHGMDGRSIINGTPNFIRGERLEKPDTMLLVTIRNGLNMMPSWKGVISDTEMEDALSYARTLRR